MSGTQHAVGERRTDEDEREGDLREFAVGHLEDVGGLDVLHIDVMVFVGARVSEAGFSGHVS